MEWNWDAVSAISGVVSGGAAFVTLWYARQAITTWREQEKLKLKIDFKKSVLKLRNLFIYMPMRWDKTAGAMSALSREATNLIHGPALMNSSIPADLRAIVDAINHANDCWVMCEHIFDDTSVQANWNVALKTIDDYLNFKVTNTDVFNALNETYSARFIFSFK